MQQNYQIQKKAKKEKWNELTNMALSLMAHDPCAISKYYNVAFMIDCYCHVHGNTV